MTWHQMYLAKQENRALHVAFLYLANDFGAVPGKGFLRIITQSGSGIFSRYMLESLLQHAQQA